jgi:hypothetical protein
MYMVPCRRLYNTETRGLPEAGGCHDSLGVSQRQDCSKTRGGKERGSGLHQCVCVRASHVRARPPRLGALSSREATTTMSCRWGPSAGGSPVRACRQVSVMVVRLTHRAPSNQSKLVHKEAQKHLQQRARRRPRLQATAARLAARPGWACAACRPHPLHAAPARLRAPRKLP